MKSTLLIVATGFLAGVSPAGSCPGAYSAPVWALVQGRPALDPWACVDSKGRIFFRDSVAFEMRGRVFNVRSYGGNGNGRGDDSPGILAAYRAATSKPEEQTILYFPPGVWRTSTQLTVDRRLNIFIDSGTLSTSAPQAFVFAPGSRGAALAGRKGVTQLRRADESAGEGSLIAIDSTSQVVIRDLELDGNGAKATRSSEHAHGILVVSSSDLLLRNLYLHDNQGDAIDLYGRSVDRIRVENVYVSNLGRAGLDLTQLTGAGLTINNFACVVGRRVSTASSAGECIHSEPAGGIVRTTNWRFNNLYLNGTGMGIASNAVGGVLREVSISGFKILAKDATGISIAGAQDVSISNGSIISDSSSRVPSFVAVKISEINPVARTGRISISRVRIAGFRLTKKSGAIFLTSSVNAQTGGLTAPLLVATQRAGGHLKDGSYSYYATSIIDGVETPSGPAASLLVKNGLGRAAIELRWNPIESMYGSLPASGYRIYGRNSAGTGLLAEVLGVVPIWSDDGSLTPKASNPPRSYAALGHVILGPGIIVEDSRDGSGIFLNTVWPHITITGDTIRRSGDRCVAFNSSVVDFDILHTECVDFGSIGIDLGSRDRVTADGRVSGNRLWNHSSGRKIGIRVQNNPSLKEIAIDNNDLRGNEMPLVVGNAARDIHLTNNRADTSVSVPRR
jgi:hypothetical protein